MNLNAITQALAAACAGVPGLQATSFVADAVNPPLVVVGEYDVEFHHAMGNGLTVIHHTARLYVTRATDQSAQTELATWIPQIKDAVESDTTLGGACQALIVNSTGKAGVYTAGGVDYVGIDFNIDVYA